MGPSVKFVSPNKGLISKKNGGQFFFRKNYHTGEGGGIWQKTILFPIFLNPSLRHAKDVRPVSLLQSASQMAHSVHFWLSLALSGSLWLTKPFCLAHKALARLVASLQQFNQPWFQPFLLPHLSCHLEISDKNALWSVFLAFFLIVIPQNVLISIFAPFTIG